MKKFLCLLLCAVMFLGLTTPSLAEETATLPAFPTLVTPVPFAAYQDHLQKLVATLVPDTAITWEEDATHPGLWVAVAQGSLMGILCTVEEGNVNEVMFIVSGELTDDMLNVFIGMSSYAIGALASYSGLLVEDAFSVSLNAVYAEMNSMLAQTPTYTLGGQPMYLIFNSEDGVTYSLQMVVDLMPDVQRGEE